MTFTVGFDHNVVDQIDGELVSVVCFDFIKQVINNELRQTDREQTVFKCIVIENIGKARCNDHSEAVLCQSPSRVFAGGAAAEILAGQQNRRTLIARLI